MPPLRKVSLPLLLLLMELLPGFWVVVGSGLLPVGALSWASFWPLLMAALTGSLFVTLSKLWPVIKLLLYATGLAVTVSIGIVLMSARVDSLKVLVPAILLAVSYWRGVVVTAERSDYEEVEGRLGFGLLLLFAGTLVGLPTGVIQQTGLWRTFALLAVGYIVVSMTALFQAKLEPERGKDTVHGLYAVIALGLVAVAVISALSFWLFSLDLVGALVQVTEGLRGALGQVLLTVARVVLSPAFNLVDLVHHHLRPTEARNLHLRPAPTTKGRLHGGREEWIFLLQLGLTICIVAFVLAALVFTLSDRAARSGKTRSKALAEEEEEETEGPRSDVGLLRQLWRLFKARLRDLLRLKVPARPNGVTIVGRRLFGAPYPSDPVRRMYAQLLVATSARGLPRATSATPREFLQQLRQRWPGGSEHFSTLTEAYILRRYGDSEFEPGQIEDLKRHWHEARALVRG